MSEAGQNEARKVAAGFLNGIAVAVLAAGLITPLIGQDLQIWRSIAAVAIALGAHGLALALACQMQE